MTLAKSDQGWISGVAGEGIATIGDPRLKAHTMPVANVADAAELVTGMTEFLSPRGERVVQDYAGYLARVIQHEVDHLDAIEFVDRMDSMQSLTTVQNYLAVHHR